MQIVKRCKEKCAMCLGNFDGIHLAHTEIVNSCVKYAKEKDLKSGILLFDCHTSEVFGKNTMLLTTLDEKIHILEDSGIDFIYVMHFDESVAKKEGEDFLREILDNFSVSAFFVGYDYAFGCGAKYRAKDLEKIGEILGFKTYITDCCKIDDIAVSSTGLREIIGSGNMKKASRILGRDYFILSRVKKGYGNGKKLLFPTANLDIPENKLIPPDGVYKAVVTISGKKYKSAVNIGKNPTFDAKKRTVEAHLIDFSGDLYDKEIKVEFLEKIRDDIKFESVEDLKEQIKSDIEKVSKINL